MFVIPGKGSYAEAWNVVVLPDDPIRSSPYDLIEQAESRAQPGRGPADRGEEHQDLRVRPAKHPTGWRRSVHPGPQPHTVQQDVDDIVKLVAAAALQPSFVVVAHSYGGIVADLLARTHPELVSGLVMVDPLSEFLPSVGTAEQNAAFERDGLVPPDPGGEGILPDDAFRRIGAAPPLPRVPAIVLSSDKFQPPENSNPTITRWRRSTRPTACSQRRSVRPTTPKPTAAIT